MKYLLEPGVRHIMIDIETLDVTFDAPILSVAAMPFWLTPQDELDFLASELGEQMGGNMEFKEFINLPEFVVNNDTFQWHMKTGTRAIENSVRYGKPIEDVLVLLDEFVATWIQWNDGYPDFVPNDYYIWGWGYGFDMTILTSAYRNEVGYRKQAMDRHLVGEGVNTAKNVNLPDWLKTYWRIIDARSVYFGHGGIWEEYRDGRQGQHHDPLDDVRHQIKTLQRVFTMEA